MMAKSRNGFVIALTLMVMLLLELLAAGMLLVALQERAVVNARVAATIARTRAETAISEQVRTWDNSGFQRMQNGAIRVVQETDATVRIERLRGDLFLLSAEAALVSGQPQRGAARASLLLRSFDASLVQRHLGAALVLSGGAQILGNTQIEATDAETACERDGPPPAGISAPTPQAVFVGGGASIVGQPDILMDTFPRELPSRLGGLTTEELARLAMRHETGRVTPAPSEVDGACDVSAPANWGAPSDPTHPCAGYTPFIFVDGDLEVSGGTGQGLLVVTGNLMLRDGASFSGIVIAGGSLMISNAAATGAVYARSTVQSSIVLDGHIRFDSCAIQRALFSTVSLQRPLFPPGRTWLPVH